MLSVCFSTLNVGQNTNISANSKSGRAMTTEDKVKDSINRTWTEFVQGRADATSGEYSGGVLQDKQNTSTHWDRQKEWIGKLEKECCGTTAA